MKHRKYEIYSQVINFFFFFFRKIFEYDYKNDNTK